MGFRGFQLPCPTLGGVLPAISLSVSHPPHHHSLCHSPQPSFLLESPSREAVSQLKPSGAGPRHSFPEPNSILKLNELAEEQGKLADATPYRLGGSGRATLHAVAQAGRAQGSAENGGGMSE